MFCWIFQNKITLSKIILSSQLLKCNSVYFVIYSEYKAAIKKAFTFKNTVVGVPSPSSNNKLLCAMGDVPKTETNQLFQLSTQRLSVVISHQTQISSSLLNDFYVHLLLTECCVCLSELLFSLRCSQNDSWAYERMSIKNVSTAF